MQGVKIILAEDDPLIRELNVKMLRDAGAKVLPAADGMEALALLKENEISLMLFDIQMPVLSGPDAVKTIRSEFSGDKQMTPVIAMTANVLQHDLRSYLDAGFNDYITKPFSEKELLDKIMKLLYPGKSFQGNAFADVEVVPPKVVSKVQTDPGYNLQALIDSARGNKDFVKKMINLFLTSSYASLNNLKFHLNRQNREQLAKTAHRMIGSCKQMGADKVAALLKQLEKETNENEPYDNLQQLVTNIETELQKIFTGLKSEQEKAETETENRPG